MILQLKIFIYAQRFKKRATYLLNAFIEIKIICQGIFSGRIFFGANFQVPHKQRFGF